MATKIQLPVILTSVVIKAKVMRFKNNNFKTPYLLSKRQLLATASLLANDKA